MSIAASCAVACGGSEKHLAVITSASARPGSRRGRHARQQIVQRKDTERALAGIRDNDRTNTLGIHAFERNADRRLRLTCHRRAARQVRKWCIQRGLARHFGGEIRLVERSAWSSRLASRREQKSWNTGLKIRSLSKSSRSSSKQNVSSTARWVVRTGRRASNAPIGKHSPVTSSQRRLPRGPVRCRSRRAPALLDNVEPPAPLPGRAW